MVIQNDTDVIEKQVEMSGAKDVSMQILIGTDDGSSNIIMRRFKIRPAGHTPHHQHNYEHVVKVLSGKGIAIDESGNEHKLQPGQSLFIEPNDLHQFKNPYHEPFEFLCIIPNPDK